jgi:kynurenine formamidase
MFPFHFKKNSVPLLLVISSLLFASCSTKTQMQKGKVVDLSYSFDEKTIYWPTGQGFLLEKGPAGFTEKGYYYASNRFQAAEHGGTHVDAPRHFYEKGHTVDQIPLDQLVGPAILVDVSAKCENRPDYQISIEDFLEWERKNGPIPKEAIVLLRTGFGKYWPDRARYMGTDERGPDAVKKLHFPGLHPKAAQWLAESRSIKAIGLDTPSIDYGQSTHFESHVALFQKNVPALENLSNLDQLPPKGFGVVALPMKIEGGSGAPTRIIAIIDEK